MNRETCLDLVAHPPLFFIIILFCFCGILSATDEEVNGPSEVGREEAKDKPPKIGNFALPASQQPSTLFGFGGNIIEEGEVEFSIFSDDLIGRRRTSIDIVPSLLYGITDNLSILFLMPSTPAYRDLCDRSRGLEDFIIQSEYAFYNKATTTYTDQATVLASLVIPTGSSTKMPPTGIGTLGLFAGGTFYRMFVDWFYFAGPFALIPGSYHGTQFGQQYYYQCGLGRSFPSPEGWIYALMVEVDGQYGKKNRIRGFVDENSGGNTVWATPSLWISNRYFVLQFGASFPVVQRLNGSQRKFDYILNLNLQWSFYPNDDKTRDCMQISSSRLIF